MSRRPVPTLNAIDGPLRGQIFALDDAQVAIGRDPDANTLALQDWSVSRRHCLVRNGSDNRVTIRDLQSKNGTFVNGLPVDERVLQDGDELRIGKSVFVFRAAGEESAVASPLQFDVSRLPRDAVTLIQPADSVTLDANVLLENPGTGGAARPLLAITRIFGVMQGIRDASELPAQLLAAAFDIAPAQSGAVLLFEGAPDEPAWTFAADRELGTGISLQLDAGVVERVRRERIGILTAASSGAAGLKRILAAPILNAGEPIGALYLESGDPRVVFERRHLELLTAVGIISGTAIENTRRLRRLELENERLRQEVRIEHDMIGAGARMREVYQFISKVAPAESTVLLCGESGTGKELVARAIHRNSPRAAGPFIAINCATLSETLLESELFGHEKGAFTGASALRKGKFEFAAGGTVFLDEIGELPLPLQAKLLRVLQEREFERLGGNRTLKTDVRVVAATNRDLEQQVASGVFRRDLYYRLNVLKITLPPLRDRREDIPVLAGHFAAKHARRIPRAPQEISSMALECLLAYDWPGNVRELENAIERAVVLGASDTILPEDLPETVLESARCSSAAPVGRYQETVSEEKKRVILKALAESNGVFTEAARLLGVHPNYLHRLVRNLNLKADIRKHGAG